MEASRCKSVRQTKIYSNIPCSGWFSSHLGLSGNSWVFLHPSRHEGPFILFRSWDVHLQAFCTARGNSNSLSLFMDGTHSSGDFTHPHFQRTLLYVLDIKQTRPNLAFTRLKHCLHYSACKFPKAEWKSPALLPGEQQRGKEAENLFGSSKKQPGNYLWDASLAEKMIQWTEIGVAATLPFKFEVMAGELDVKDWKSTLGVCDSFCWAEPFTQVFTQTHQSSGEFLQHGERCLSWG